MIKPSFFKRQLDLVKPKDLRFPIIVIGAGGIGSWTVLCLAKMGCNNLTVVDHDKVEKHNIPSQFYQESQIGKPKVEALKENVMMFSGSEIKTFNCKYQDVQGWTDKYELVICALDSMKERKNLWMRLFDEKDKFSAYIDARMGGELLRIFVVNPGDYKTIDRYDKSLLGEPHEEKCTGRSIVYNTFSAGGLVASIVKKYAKKETVK